MNSSPGVSSVARFAEAGTMAEAGTIPFLVDIMDHLTIRFQTFMNRLEVLISLLLSLSLVS